MQFPATSRYTTISIQFQFSRNLLHFSVHDHQFQSSNFSRNLLQFSVLDHINFKQTVSTFNAIYCNFRCTTINFKQTVSIFNAIYCKSSRPYDEQESNSVPRGVSTSDQVRSVFDEGIHHGYTKRASNNIFNQQFFQQDSLFWLLTMHRIQPKFFSIFQIKVQQFPKQNISPINFFDHTSKQQVCIFISFILHSATQQNISLSSLSVSPVDHIITDIWAPF